MKENYFVYNAPYGEYNFHATLADALADARVCVIDCLDVGEWDEEVGNIYVGEVSHRVVPVNVTERPPEEELDEEGYDEEGDYWGDGISHRCNYVLEGVESEKRT